MKLTLQELKEMVQKTLNEEKGCAPKPLEDETDDGIESAEDSLDNDQVIIRFYENEENDDEKKLEENDDEDDGFGPERDPVTLEPLSPGDDHDKYDLEDGVPKKIRPTFIPKDEDLKEAIRQELFKYLKK